MGGETIVIVVALLALLGVAVILRYRGEGEAEFSIRDWVRFRFAGKNTMEDTQGSEVRLEPGAQIIAREVVAGDKITHIYPPPVSGPATSLQLPDLTLWMFRLDQRTRTYVGEITLGQTGGSLPWNYVFGLALENTASTAIARGIDIRVELWWGGGEHLQKAPELEAPRVDGWETQHKCLIYERPAVLIFSDPNLICFPGQPREWKGFKLTLYERWNGWFGQVQNLL